MNPLIGMMAKNNVDNSGPGQMMQQFRQFRQWLGNRDPNQMINEMLQSGQINQQQLEQAKAMAEQMGGMFK